MFKSNGEGSKTASRIPSFYIEKHRKLKQESDREKFPLSSGWLKYFDILLIVIDFLDKKSALALIYCFLLSNKHELKNQDYFGPLKFFVNTVLKKEQIEIFGDANSFFIKTHSGFYGYGDNSSAQLGLGEVNMITAPKKIRLPNDEKILRAKSGVQSTFIVTTLGNVYSSGINTKGRLGIKDCKEGALVKNFTLIPFFNQHIVDVISGGANTYFISKTGDVFGCGYNFRGALGVGSTKTQFAPTPVKLEQKQIIKVVTCGSKAYFITSENSVLACGTNFYGVLGVGDTTHRDIPVPVKLQEKVKEVFTHDRCTFFLTEAGNVYACGVNNSGQLGVGDTTDKSIPTKVNLGNQKVFNVIISESGSSTYFITESNTIYACGHNHCGQLGIGSKDNQLNPVEVKLENLNIRQVVSAAIKTYFITDSGDIYFSGKNKIDDKQDCDTPILLKTLGKKIKQIFVTKAPDDGRTVYSTETRTWITIEKEYPKIVFSTEKNEVFTSDMVSEPVRLEFPPTPEKNAITAIQNSSAEVIPKFQC